MIVNLIKVKSSHNNLRTPEVFGRIEQLPIVGNSFFLLAAGLDFGTRIVQTTPVQSVEKLTDTLYTFKTENSEYKLEIKELPEDATDEPI